MKKNKMKKMILWAVGIILVLLSGISLEAAEPRVVRVGAFNYYPGIFKDTDGVVKGFYVDALADIGRRENIRFEYVYGSWADGLERIQSGKVDVLTSVAFTEERARFLDYTITPLLTVWAELYTTAESLIDGILEVQGKKIAVMKGDYNAGNFINLVKNFHITCDLVEKPGFDEVFKAVASKEADAGVVNSTFGSAKHRGYGLRSTGIVFNPFDIFFAVAKDKNQDLLALLETNLANWRIQAHSPYEKARRKWLHQADTITVIPRWLVIVLIATGISALVAGAFILALKQQVKRKTLSLIESADRYKILAARHGKMVANIGDVIVIIDEVGIIRYKSPNIEKRFGWKPEELIGISAWDTIHPEDLSAARTFFEEMMQEPDAVGTMEFRYKHRDGGYRWIEFTGINLFHDPDIGGLLGNYQDITERKQEEAEKEKLQAQLLQAQKMESVGRLAGGVAHDFNNMLGVILGHAEMALEEVEENHPLYIDLKEIQAAAQRSADLTRQLLTFARKQMISPKVLNLNQAVQQMITMLHRLIGEDIDLVWQPAQELWPVKIDPSQVDQILANLCVNARDAVSGVGKITIETGMKTFDPAYCTEHTGFAPGDFVLLAVSDNGCGMDRKTLDSLFEPFFTTKDLGKGTGLGLAMVYGIVKQNQGFINVYSEPGKGTTFRIYLPRYLSGDPAVIIKPSGEAVPGGNETLLLVEDETAILGLARMMLERMGYRVLAASTPTEAIQLARAHAGKIDLLMTDVVMPEMNGRDLAVQLTRLYPDLKLLFMSGYTADVIAHHGVLDEGVYFIQKPFSKKELALKLREALDAATGDLI